MPDPILDLSTIIPDRAIVRIDGEPFELAVHDDFGLEDKRTLENLWRRMNELETSGITEEDDIEFKSVVRQLATKLLRGVTEDTIAKLSTRDQGAITAAFFANGSDPKIKLLMRALMDQMQARSTGDESSPDSSDSTVETPSDGSIPQPATSASTTSSSPVS